MPGYAVFPSGAENVWTSDTSLEAEQDIDVRLRVSVPGGWDIDKNSMFRLSRSSGSPSLAARTDAAGNGRLEWVHTAVAEYAATADHGLPADTFVWVRYRLLGTTLTLSVSEDDTDDHTAVSWTQTGDPRTVSALSLISYDPRIANNLVAETHYKQVVVLIDGTVDFDADIANLTAEEVAAEEFTESSANAATVTMDGTGWSYVTAEPASSFAQAVLIITGTSAATPNTGKSSAPGNSPESEAD